MSSLLAAGKPNTLTPRQIEDGWILLFDGETAFGWQNAKSSGWTVENGCLTCRAPGAGRLLRTTTEFADFELELEVQAQGGATAAVFVRCPGEASPGEDNSYEAVLAGKDAGWSAGDIRAVARATTKPAGKGWRRFTIIARGGALLLEQNAGVLSGAVNLPIRRGRLALWAKGAGQVRVRNVRLRPLGLQSIFNGKDLSGWRVLPGHKSVYSVTPEGWLNVRNGSGDLQTEKTYGDFVLQLDIISNGDHLNSGVFFRAIPGKFWSGYESQIRNQWRDGDRTKPVDYGTGGIYNRQPARKVVSSDYKWFTKTIIAHGRHIAVWVDGCQVSDWTDPRPPNENARVGYRAKPGVISLQGHDPTTNLSFRNIRVMEYPPAQP